MGISLSKNKQKRRLMPWTMLSSDDYELFNEEFYNYSYNLNDQNDEQFPMIDENTIILAKFKKDIDVFLTINQLNCIIGNRKTIITPFQSNIILEGQHYIVWGYIQIII